MNKMKKSMVYIVPAILLGSAIMMLPLALEAGPPTYTPEFFQHPKTNKGVIPGEESQMLRFSGLGKQPSNLLPSSLILFLGLMVALGVYAVFKRRMI